MNLQNLPELFDRCAENFAPKTLDAFVGEHSTDKGAGARATAAQIERAFALATAAGRQPQKLLFPGDPGVGKSLMVKFIQHLTGCNKWSTSKFNGTQCKIETVEQIAHELAMTNLFGDWRMVWIDEADAIPTVAQVRFLTLLDDLPKGAIVCCTSNLTLKAFENRFQSRFQAYPIIPPGAEEILRLLQRFAPDEPELVNIARFACGNVRQALMDLKGLVESGHSPVLSAAA